MLYGGPWFIFAKILVVEVGHRKVYKRGKGRLSTWVLHILPEQVKNGMPCLIYKGSLTQQDRLCEREAVTAAGVHVGI